MPSAQIFKPAYAATSPWGDEPTRQTACPPIEWEHVSATPLPEVHESNSDSAWAVWDAAVKAEALK
jgi:hypothetical protein